MIITLSDDEIREVLLEAVSNKTSYMYGDAVLDNSYFNVYAAGQEIDDVTNITFSVVFD